MLSDTLTIGSIGLSCNIININRIFIVMRKIIITESQLKRLLKEDVSVNIDNSNPDDIASTHEKEGYWEWLHDDLNALAKQFNAPLNYIKTNLQKVLYAAKEYFGYNLKRVLVADDDKVVGFLVWADQGTQLDDIGDGNNYQVLIATAISPEYRGRGLFNKMLTKSDIKKPFIVQLNPTSPMDFWSRYGCKVEKTFPDGNKIAKCS